MIEISVRAVDPAQVDALKEWFVEVQGPRRDEALLTLVDETCRHEQAVLVFHGDQPLLVYVMEVEDPDAARRSALSGAHSIDAEHRAVMQRVIAHTPAQEIVLDLRP